MRLRTLRSGLAVLMSFGLLVGCGDDGGRDEADAAPSAGAGGTPSRTASPAGSPSGPAPADGLQVVEPGFTFNAPQGWQMDGRDDSDPEARWVAIRSVERGLDSVTAETWADPGFTDVAELPPYVWENFSDILASPRKLGTTDWAGEPAYHFVGVDEAFRQVSEQYGVIWRGNRVFITIDLDQALPDAERRTLIESIEASWQWR